MNQIEEKIVFSGTGLDYDSDTLSIANGKSRYRLNIVEKDGDLGVLTNIMGNRRLNTNSEGGYLGTVFPITGTNKTIGVVEDKEDGTCIEFLYNSSGNHSIIANDPNNDEDWFILDGSMDSGAVGTTLNFQETSFIKAGIIGNGDDKYLAWTDGYNPPRLINITMAKNYTASSGSPAYTEINDYVVSLYKKPYMKDITLQWGTRSDSINNLLGKVWQFAIRKKFYDNTYSVLSAPSVVPLAEGAEMGNGVYASDYFHNQLIIYITLDDDDEIVSEYQLCYRIVDVGSGVPSSWYLANIELRESGGNYFYRFYNDKIGVALSSDDTSRFYDYVPDKADSLAIIDSNRIVLAGITEGYDNIAKSAFATAYTSTPLFSVSQAVTGTGGVVTALTDYNNIAISGGTFDFLTNKSATDDYYYLLVLEHTVAAVSQWTLTSSYNMNGEDVADYFVANVSMADVVVTKQVSGSDYYIRVTNNNGANTLHATLYVLEGYTKIYSHKSGTVERYGIQYYNNGKPWAIQTSEEFNVRIPYLYEATGTYTWSNFYNEVDWAITHTPPTGATHWQWVYLGSNVDYYEHYLLDYSQDLTYEGEYIKIGKSVIANFKSAYSSNIDYGFSISEGDRVRFIGYFQPYTETGGDVFDGIKLYTDLYDYEILKVDSSYFYIKNPGEGFIEALDGADTSYGCCIEVYRKKQISEDTGIYQTIGEVFNVTGGYHMGDDQDQTAIQAATGTFNPYWGHAVMSKQGFITANNFSDYTGTQKYSFGWIEMYSASILYDSRIDTFGKGNTVDDFAQQKYYGRLTYGGQFFDNSGVNFLSRFESDDVRDYDERNGYVTHMEQIGNTLNVYQERKVTSYYLKSIYASDPDNNQQLSFSDTVMSEGRPSVTDYGCTHYTSFVKNPRQAYFFDINNAVVLRDTTGGIVSINDDMDDYFESKSQAILASSDTIHIFGGWDEQLKMYFLTFINEDDSESSINETIGYSEDGGYWVSFYSFLPEYYGKTIGEFFLSFKDGACYTHNSNSTRNNFYGSQYGSSVWVHATQNPTLNKIYNSIEISGVGQWAAPSSGDILITKPRSMSSRLKAGRFVLQEGIYRSDFMRDETTTGSANVTDLHNGRNLRGHEMTIKLSNSNTTQAELNYVIVNSSISK